MLAQRNTHHTKCFTLYASLEVPMKDVLPTIEQWRARGERVAIATVVKTLGSAPRGVGAKMAV
ncbi:MAG TPA: XdhC family protein, partial [Roseiflexaceae bacterium]